jgi:transcription termination/antitermination protein NusG
MSEEKQENENKEEAQEETQEQDVQPEAQPEKQKKEQEEEQNNDATEAQKENIEEEKEEQTKSVEGQDDSQEEKQEAEDVAFDKPEFDVVKEEPAPAITIRGLGTLKEEKEEEKEEEPEQKSEVIEALRKEQSEEEEGDVEEKKEALQEPTDSTIFALRTTANREDQVMDFITSNAEKKKLEVYAVVRPHGMRGYIFVEAKSQIDAEQAAMNIPYARGVLPNPVQYKEIEHMLEQVKQEVNIKKNDIAEIISGPFKREKCKITRIEKTKEEVVVELLEAAVPIPITVKMDAVKVIRRDGEDEDDE